MKRPPWHQDLLAVAALPTWEKALLAEQYVLPAVIVFAGAGAWGRARVARAELAAAEARGHGKAAVTVLPPGESPAHYDWRVLRDQVVTIYLCDDDRELLRRLGEALLAAGVRVVYAVDGREERPRPLIAEISARKAA